MSTIASDKVKWGKTKTKEQEQPETNRETHTWLNSDTRAKKDESLNIGTELLTRTRKERKKERKKQNKDRKNKERTNQEKKKDQLTGSWSPSSCRTLGVQDLDRRRPRDHSDSLGGGRGRKHSNQLVSIVLAEKTKAAPHRLQTPRSRDTLHNYGEHGGD